MRFLPLLVTLTLTTPAFAAGPKAHEICQFAVQRECTPAQSRCIQDVDKSNDEEPVKVALRQACIAKGTACAERMRKSDSDCEALRQNLDAILRNMNNRPH